MRLSAGRYKVKVRHISADAHFTGLENSRKAYLGISLNNPIFWHYSFIDVLHWFVRDFSEPYILVGDYLNRWNDMIFYSLSKEECIQKSLKEANDLRLLFQNYDITPTFRELNWKELTNTSLFCNAIVTLERLYDTNSFFSGMIQESARDFILRQIERGQQPIIARSIAIEYSIAYLLEELAVFQVLIEKGIPVQIYPGKQLPVLRALHSSMQMKMPTVFKQGVFVELRVKKK